MRCRVDRRWSVLVGVLAVAVTSLACTTPTTEDPVPAVAGASSAGLAPPDHAVIVVLENKDADTIAAHAPYLTALAGSGTTLTDMHAETHPSQPNYLALYSGDTQGVHGDDCPHTFDAPTLGSELAAARLSFAGYSEGLPEPGFTGCQSGDYARKHSPWTNFSTDPPSVNQPLTALPTEYARWPTVSFVIPDLCHDMHDCSVGDGDAWLRDHLDGYARWAMTHNSMLLVTFDESESQRDDDNQIATFAVGQHVPRGADDERADHYRILRTLEDMYGLAPLGHAADTAALTGLWR